MSAFAIRWMLRRSAPWWSVLAALALGGLTIVVIAIFHEEEAALLPSFLTVSDWETIVEVPFTEELAKALAACGALLLARRTFRDEVDGFYFGFLAGLGFAIVENQLYFSDMSSIDALEHVLLTRNLFATSGHAVSTAVFGAALGLGRRIGWSRRLFPATVAAFVAALVWHGAHNAWVRHGPALYLLWGLAVQPVVAVALLVLARRSALARVER